MHLVFREKNWRSPYPHEGVSVNDHFIRNERKKIYDSAIDAICHTPMIRLNNIPQEEGIKCEMRKLNF